MSSSDRIIALYVDKLEIFNYYTIQYQWTKRACLEKGSLKKKKKGITI